MIAAGRSGLALSLAVSALVAVAACSSDDDTSGSAQASPPPKAPLLGCRQRVEGGGLEPEPPLDLVAGPFAYVNF